jgi:hypothetical protein
LTFTIDIIGVVDIIDTIAINIDIIAIVDTLDTNIVLLL